MTDEELHEFNREFWAEMKAEKAAKQRAKQNPKQSSSAGARDPERSAWESIRDAVGSLNMPPRRVAAEAAETAAKTFFPFAVSGAESVATGKGMRSFDPAGLSATAGDELFFGLPRKLNKDIRESATKYETRYPMAAKRAKFLGEAASYTPLPVTPLSALAGGVRGAGRLAGKSSVLLKDLARKRWSKNALEGAALGGALGGLEAIGSPESEDNDVAGSAIGSALVGGALGAAAPALTNFLAGVRERTFPSLTKNKVTAWMYRGVKDNVSKEAIDRSVKEAIPLIETLDTEGTGYFGSKAAENPELRKKLKNLRGAFENNLKERTEGAINRYISNEPVEERLARINYVGSQRARPRYAKAFEFEVSAPDDLKKLASNRKVEKAIADTLENNQDLANKYAGKKYNVEILDAAKKRLESDIDFAKNTFDNSKAQDLLRAADIIRNAGDNATTKYKEARKLAQNYLRHEDAANAGIEYANRADKPKTWRDFRDGSPLSNLRNSGEEKSFLSGFSDSLKDKFLRKNKNLNMFTEAAFGEQLKNILPKSKREGFENSIDRLLRGRKNYEILATDINDFRKLGNPTPVADFTKAASGNKRWFSRMLDKVAGSRPFSAEYIDILERPEKLKRFLREGKQKKLESDLLHKWSRYGTIGKFLRQGEEGNGD